VKLTEYRIIIRPSNNYGHWQYPEKLVPVIILKALHNKKVPVYGKGINIREWLHVSDSVSAISLVMQKGKIGEIYNVGSQAEKQNIVTVKKILKLLNKPFSLIQYVKDIRYSVSFTKIKKLGWKPKMSYEKGMQSTVEWNINNLKWLENKLTYLASYWKKVYKTK